MILENEVAEGRLNSPDNLVNRFRRDPGQQDRVEIVQKERIGRKPEVENLPVPVRNAAAILSLSGMPQQQVADLFGTTQGNISKYTQGKGTDKVEIEDKVNKIKDVALTRLMDSLGLLDTEKMNKCKAGELSTVAANLSRIVEKVSPSKGETQAINLVIYSPALRDEKGYKVIDV